ncbi:MAG: hypothetical protein ACYDCJ_08625 [Gammaproteobacteria bacterium]
MATVLLAIAWLGSWAVCPPAQAELPGSAAMHQSAGHPDGDACFHLFDYTQVPTARYAMPVAGHLRSGTPVPSAALLLTLPALRLMAWKTLQAVFPSTPSLLSRHITPRWAHAPPSLI